jgi:hypothetical protein
MTPEKCREVYPHATFSLVDPVTEPYQDRHRSTFPFDQLLLFSCRAERSHVGRFEAVCLFFPRAAASTTYIEITEGMDGRYRSYNFDDLVVPA